MRGAIGGANVALLRTAFRRAHLSGAPLVRVDLTDCESLDPAGVAALLGLERRVCRSIGRDLELVPSAGLLRPLAQLGLDDYFADPG